MSNGALWLIKIIQPLISLAFRKIDQIKMIEIQTRIFSDNQRKFSQAGYVYAQTIDNQISGLIAAGRLLENAVIEKIAIVDGETDHGATGYLWCKDKLCAMEIYAEKIEKIEMPKNVGINTLSESEYLISHAKNMGWRSIYISTAPFHQLRALMTCISVAIKIYPELRIYSAPGTYQNWNEYAIHSQGVVGDTRKNLLSFEIAAIARYTKKGDILSADKILKYLDDIS